MTRLHAYANLSMTATNWTTDRRHQLVTASAYHLRRFLSRIIGMEASSNNDSRSFSEDSSTSYDTPSSSSSHVLPDSLLLEIFSRLDPQDLGRASCVSWQWNRVASDELLWRAMIRRDSSKWQNLSHEANPELFEATASDLANKERYLRCSPQFRHHLHRLETGLSTRSITRLLPDLLRRAWPFYRRPLPKFAILGPGLDKGGVSVARKFVYDIEGQFDVGKGFPGTKGIGSGFVCTMRHGPDSEGKTESVFGISFLYSATMSEREAQKNNRMQLSNKLFTVVPKGNSFHRELSPEFKNLCLSLSGLIYVLSATTELSDDQEKNTSDELAALTNYCWEISSGKPIPLIVVSIVHNKEHESLRKIDCPEAIRLLKLNTVRLPWCVYNARVEDAAGIIDGILWMLDIYHDRVSS